MHGSKINKNPSWRSREVAVAIQAIPNYIRDLIRILNEFSIKICLYLDGHGAKEAPRHDDSGSHATMPAGAHNDVVGIPTQQ
ncbi:MULTISPECIES: hypothetical protein [unclassified Rickettsia]|uniref:hypothetical protein n=1 Tax=unclassified Rickettsia TaxID=114295 RepID=UPI003132CBF7